MENINTVNRNLYWRCRKGLWRERNKYWMTQSAGAAEYTNCISVEWLYFPKKFPGYDTKQSGGEALVMLELWGMQSTLLIQLLPDPLWPRVEALDRVLSMGQIELNCVFMLNGTVWNRTIFTFKLCTYAKLNWLK